MRREIELELDTAGELCLPRLHDASLVGLSLGPCGNLEIALVQGTERFILLIEGLVRVRVVDFREGNVVLGVWIAPPTAGEGAFRELLVGLDLEPDSDYAAELLKSHRCGKTRAVHITPSYGCELVAIGGLVRAFRVDRQGV